MTALRAWEVTYRYPDPETCEMELGSMLVVARSILDVCKMAVRFHDLPSEDEIVDVRRHPAIDVVIPDPPAPPAPALPSVVYVIRGTDETFAIGATRADVAHMIHEQDRTEFTADLESGRVWRSTMQRKGTGPMYDIYVYVDVVTTGRPSEDTP